MQFDCIIMNPPYQRNLHLKILAEALKHLRDEKSVCVNLSPDSWITNPFKMFEKAKLRREAVETIGCHVKSYEGISSDEFNSLFSTHWNETVGIVACVKGMTGFDCSKWNSTDKLLLKIVGQISAMPSLRSKFTKRITSKKFVPVRRRTYKTYSYCELDDSKIDARDGILFDTEAEAANFKKSILNTWLYRWLYTTEWHGSENSASVPFLGSATNPRTGLKGYLGEWTDDDLFQFFGLTDEEQKVIEETMRKYK